MADEREDGEDLEPIDGGGVRSLWSGSITFGLLSLAVDLFPAVRTEALPLKLVDSSLRPLTRRYMCPEHERFLARDEIVRGFELDDGEFVVVTDDELEALAPEKSRAIDLRKFVDIAEIDPMYFERSYFLTPAENEANRAYRLLAETMERSGRAGIATFVMRGKEYLVALLAENGVLRAETLRFSDEIRAAEDVGLPIDAEADPRHVERFRRAIDALAADEVDRALLRDERIERLRALIDDKLARGVDVEKAPEAEEEDEAEIIDLMEVLKRRLQPEQRERAPAAPQAARHDEGRGRAGADDLESRSKSELYERAKALNLPGRSKMGKDELIRALRRAGG
ncbi:MAG TPA: Ku protein [Gammaproteobacteria bacterium]